MKTFSQLFAVVSVPSSITGVKSLSGLYNGAQALALLTHEKGANAQINGLSLAIVLTHAAYNGGGKLPEVSGKGQAKDALRAGFAAVTAMPVCRGGDDPRHLRPTELEEAIRAFADGYDVKVRAINLAAEDAAKVSKAQTTTPAAEETPATPAKAETPEEKASREAADLAAQFLAMCERINTNGAAMGIVKTTAPGLLAMLAQEWAPLVATLPAMDQPAAVAEGAAVVELQVAETITMGKAAPRKSRAKAAKIAA